MKIIKGVNSAKFSTHQLLRNNQRQVSKTTSVLHIKYLEREDHNAEVKCIAVNTNLTKPPEKSFRINLVRKYDYLVQIFQWKLINRDTYSIMLSLNGYKGCFIFFQLRQHMPALIENGDILLLGNYITLPAMSWDQNQRHTSKYF